MKNLAFAPPTVSPPPSPPLHGVCAGTSPTSGWTQYGPDGIYRDVDLSGCGFTQAPIISSSLAGITRHWTARGGSAPYGKSANGFRIYVSEPGITPSDATAWGWKINWIAAKPIMSSEFCAGTSPTSGWTQYGANGIYRDVDLSGCGFTQAPIISSSLAGITAHGGATGGSAPYSITANGFRIYVAEPHERGIRASDATAWGWKINWIASPN